jgi:hypothetical protein
MKTAVEYLLHMYALQGAIYQYDIDKAIEMEKEQIIKAYNESFLLRDKPYATAEKYYNQTFTNYPEIPTSSNQQ